MRSEIVAECSNVKKYYPVPLSMRSILSLRLSRKRKLVLDDISISVNRGEIFGIIGPNGAGKTTIMKIMCHLTAPSAGKALVCGHDVEKEWPKVLNRIGYCISEERSFFWRLSGRQNLEFFSALMEVPARTMHRKIEELLELLDLRGAADDRFMNYSSGMKQKMAIARSLLADPEVLLMDEPTKGLDPGAAFKIRTFIEDYIASRDKTAIFTTNRVGDIENLCRRIAILNKGRIVTQGSVADIRSSFRESTGIMKEVSFEEIFNRMLESNEEARREEGAGR